MATTTNGQPTAPKRAVAYARVSTQAQANAGDLDVQITKIRDWAIQNDIEIVEAFSEVQNGRFSKREARPQLFACFRSAIKGGYLIFATDPSRITRDADVAEHWDSILKNRFRFLKRVPGYQTQPWSLEVAEVHSKQQENVSTGTILAMDKQKRNGRKFGGPDGGKAGRAVSVQVRGSKKLLREKAIADFLHADPKRLAKNCRDMGPLLDAAGIHPASGGSWTVDALRRPLREAKKLLRGGPTSKQSGAPPVTISASGKPQANHDEPANGQAVKVQPMTTQMTREEPAATPAINDQPIVTQPTPLAQTYPDSDFPEGKRPAIWGMF